MRKTTILVALLAIFLLGLPGCGGSDITVPGPVSVELLPPSPPEPVLPQTFRYLLAPNNRNLEGSVDVFRVNADDGSLSPVNGSPFALALPVHALAVHPNNTFLYAGVDDLTYLIGLQIDAVTGKLTPLPNFPLGTVNDNAPRFDRTGRFLYVVGQNDVDGFVVNPNTGFLLRLPGFPLVVPGMTDAVQSTVSLDNHFLYITDRGTDDVFTFNLNPATGALSIVGQTPTGGLNPLGIDVDPSGQFLYVSTTDGFMHGFLISETGTLTPIPGATVKFAEPDALAFQFSFKNGNLYVGNTVNKVLNGFQLGDDGSLIQLPGLPIAAGASGVSGFPNSPFIYTSDFIDSAIHGFTADASGNLAPVPGSPYQADGGPGYLVPVVVTK